MANSARTLVLMAALTALFVWIGGELGARQGAVLAFVAAAVMNFGAYWFSDKLVLKQYQAHEVTESENSRLYNTVATLTRQANLPMPKVYVIPQQTPNAFATFAGAIAMLAQFAQLGAGGDQTRRRNPLLLLFVMIGAPIVALIIRMTISRVREYAADRGGAQISGKPLGLSRALSKISGGARQIPLQRTNPAHAHMFIVNPFLGSGLQKLFSSHPPVEERIARLEDLARRGLDPKLQAG